MSPSITIPSRIRFWHFDFFSVRLCFSKPIYSQTLSIMSEIGLIASWQPRAQRGWQCWCLQEPISCQKKRRKNSGSKWPFSTSFLVMKYAQESVQKSCSNSLSIPALYSFYFSALVSINTQLQMARLCKDRSLIFINKVIIFWRSRGASEEAFVARIFSFSVLATDCTFLAELSSYMPPFIFHMFIRTRV